LRHYGQFLLIPELFDTLIQHKLMHTAQSEATSAIYLRFRERKTEERRTEGLAERQDDGVAVEGQEGCVHFEHSSRLRICSHEDER